MLTARLFAVGIAELDLQEMGAWNLTHLALFIEVDNEPSSETKSHCATGTRIAQIIQKHLRKAVLV